MVVVVVKEEEEEKVLVVLMVREVLIQPPPDAMPRKYLTIQLLQVEAGDVAVTRVKALARHNKIQLTWAIIIIITITITITLNKRF
jgi:hypothetical protein